MNILRLALPAALLAVMAVAAGCKGSGGLSLEDYLKRIEEADNQSSERYDALRDQLDLLADQSAPDQERIDAAQSAVPEFASILDDFLAALEALDPPSEVEKEHEEALAAGEATSELFDDVATQVGNAESLIELDQALQPLNGPAYIAADERFTGSCLALQATADLNKIDVNLDCAE
jgi:hypothetical protein